MGVYGSKQLKKKEKDNRSFDQGFLTKGPSLYYVSKETGWVGSEKGQLLLTFSTIYAEVEWVGGSEKDQKCADVI